MLRCARRRLIHGLIWLALFSASGAWAQLYSYRSPQGQLVITDRPIDKKGYTLVDRYISPEAKQRQREASRKLSPYQLSWSQIDGLVQPIARTYGVDPDLVKAIIAVESDRNARAYSAKNAIGLMQLIPDTADRFNVKDPWDPRQNIKGGIKYLKFLLGYFEGHVDWVLSAYNAGEYAVDKYGGVPPFKETRNYIRKVRRYYTSRTHSFDPSVPYRSVLIPDSGKPSVKPIDQVASAR